MKIEKIYTSTWTTIGRLRGISDKLYEILTSQDPFFTETNFTSENKKILFVRVNDVRRFLPSNTPEYQELEKALKDQNLDRIYVPDINDPESFKSPFVRS